MILTVVITSVRISRVSLGFFCLGFLSHTFLMPRSFFISYHFFWHCLWSTLYVFFAIIIKGGGGVRRFFAPQRLRTYGPPHHT